jgi:Carboxypeptidase regulatory-like domain
MKRFLMVVGVCLVLLGGCASVDNSSVPTAAPINPLNANSTALPALAPPAAGTTPQAQGQQQQCASRLIGHVYDNQNQAVNGATVDIQAAQYHYNTLSDSNGSYGFYGLCAGTYQFNVTLPGQAAKPVPLTAGMDGSNSESLDLYVE